MSRPDPLGAGSPAPRDRRRLVQDEIVRAAALCFREHGYRPTTLDAIAARAGISKVTLYHYVSSKEELLCQVFERTIESFRTGLRRIVEVDLPADETLRRILRYQVELLAGHLPFLTVFFSEESGLPPEMARRVARAKREYDRAIERVIRAGIREGQIRDLPPTLLVFALLGMCNWLHKWYRPGGALTPDEIAALFVDLAEHGYLRRGREPTGDSIARALRRVEEGLARLERRAASRGRARRRPATGREA
jgi:AcrR family transcriptional regulator